MVQPYPKYHGKSTSVVRIVAILPWYINHDTNHTSSLTMVSPAWLDHGILPPHEPPGYLTMVWAMVNLPQLSGIFRTDSRL